MAEDVIRADDFAFIEHGTSERAATSLTLTSSANPSILGHPVTFTATVAAASGTPTGSVQFQVDDRPRV